MQQKTALMAIPAKDAAEQLNNLMMSAQEEVEDDQGAKRLRQRMHPVKAP
jgi:hypothetical protein